jgi:hypothetical protein
MRGLRTKEEAVLAVEVTVTPLGLMTTDSWLHFKTRGSLRQFYIFYCLAQSLQNLWHLSLKKYSRKRFPQNERL